MQSKYPAQDDGDTGVSGNLHHKSTRNRKAGIPDRHTYIRTRHLRECQHFRLCLRPPILLQQKLNQSNRVCRRLEFGLLAQNP
jgi:hypothetical protein